MESLKKNDDCPLCHGMLLTAISFFNVITYISESLLVKDVIVKNEGY